VPPGDRRRVGIIDDGPPRAVTGADLDRMDDAELRDLLADPVPLAAVGR